MAKAFDVDLQIVRVQVQSAREEQANREAKEQEAHREWLCNVKVDEAGAAVERWRPDVARVRVVWENAKSSCGDLWSPIHQQRMDNMVRESADQDELRKNYPGEAEKLTRSPRPKSRPRNDLEEKNIRDRVLGP
jgi:hypothetical protein